MNQTNICLFAEIFIENPELLDESLKQVHASAKMASISFYDDIANDKPLNNINNVYEKLLNKETTHVFIRKNQLFARLEFEPMLTFRLYPIVQSDQEINALEFNLSDYFHILLTLCDNFKIQEMNSVGGPINRD